MKMTRLTRSAAAAALALSSMATLLPGSIGVASASGTGTVNTTTTMRSTNDTRGSAVRSVPQGAPISLSCWRDGGSFAGTNRWFRGSYGGQRGWVIANHVSNQPSLPRCTDLLPGEVLFSNQSLVSANGRLRLIMQGDNNLVLYSGSTALWSTRTHGKGAGAARVIQQPDGNLVVYDANNSPLWHTGTMNAGVRAVLQTDSNFVLYLGSTPLYATSWYRTVGSNPATRNGGVAGNCTWYALERFKADTGYYGGFYGDAHNWNDAAIQRGMHVHGTPMTHAVVVFEKSGPGSVGHVAWVDAVQIRSDGTWIHLWEMNWTGLHRVSERWIKHGAGMSYVSGRQL